jgi:hypothetical protein
LFFKIALKQHSSVAVRFEERSYLRYQTVSFKAIILFVPLAHPMEYTFEALRRLSENEGD